MSFPLPVVGTCDGRISSFIASIATQAFATDHYRLTRSRRTISPAKKAVTRYSISMSLGFFSSARRWGRGGLEKKRGIDQFDPRPFQFSCVTPIGTVFLRWQGHSIFSIFTSGTAPEKAGHASPVRHMIALETPPSLGRAIILPSWRCRPTPRRRRIARCVCRFLFYSNDGQRFTTPSSPLENEKREFAIAGDQSVLHKSFRLKGF